MGRLVNVTVSGVLVLGGLAVAGCGGSSSTSSSSKSSTQAGSTSQNTQTEQGTERGEGAAKPTGPKEHVPNNVIKLSSPAVKEGAAIPARYTCDGSETSPPLHWSGVPQGAAELIVFISNFEGTTPEGGTPISWGVAGLRPSLTSIPAGKLPAGAVVGRNSFGRIGYTLCPAKGSPVQHYVVVVYALPRPLGPRPGFSTTKLSSTASHTAEYSGLMGFSYKR